jgi:hypothetical protein
LEHSIALLFVVLFPCPFFSAFQSLLLLFSLLFVKTDARNTYRSATRTSVVDIYSILLSMIDLCATYIFIIYVSPKLHIYFRSVQKKTLAILVLRPHREHESIIGCTIHCFALVRTL